MLSVFWVDSKPTQTYSRRNQAISRKLGLDPVNSVIVPIFFSYFQWPRNWPVEVKKEETSPPLLIVLQLFATGNLCRLLEHALKNLWWKWIPCVLLFSELLFCYKQPNWKRTWLNLPTTIHSFVGYSKMSTLKVLRSTLKVHRRQLRYIASHANHSPTICSRLHNNRSETTRTTKIDAPHWWGNNLVYILVQDEVYATSTLHIIRWVSKP